MPRKAPARSRQKPKPRRRARQDGSSVRGSVRQSLRPDNPVYLAPGVKQRASMAPLQRASMAPAGIRPKNAIEHLPGLGHEAVELIPARRQRGPGGASVKPSLLPKAATFGEGVVAGDRRRQPPNVMDQELAQAMVLAEQDPDTYGYLVGQVKKYNELAAKMAQCDPGTAFGKTDQGKGQFKRLTGLIVGPKAYIHNGVGGNGDHTQFLQPKPRQPAVIESLHPVPKRRPDKTGDKASLRPVNAKITELSPVVQKTVLPQPARRTYADAFAQVDPLPVVPSPTSARALATAATQTSARAADLAAAHIVAASLTPKVASSRTSARAVADAETQTSVRAADLAAARLIVESMMAGRTPANAGRSRSMGAFDEHAALSAAFSGGAKPKRAGSLGLFDPRGTLSASMAALVKSYPRTKGIDPFASPDLIAASLPDAVVASAGGTHTASPSLPATQPASASVKNEAASVRSTGRSKPSTKPKASGVPVHVPGPAAFTVFRPGDGGLPLAATGTMGGGCRTVRRRLKSGRIVPVRVCPRRRRPRPVPGRTSKVPRL